MIKKVVVLIGVLTVLLFLPCSSLSAQVSLLEEVFRLKPGDKTVQKAIQELSEKGANLSFRNDQLPQRMVSIPGESRSLGYWLDYLLSFTELTYLPGAGGQSITLFRDPKIVAQKYTLYGVVSDAESGERLINANIFIPGRNEGVITNEYGFYSLSLTGGEIELRFSYIGYGEKIKQFVLRENRVLNLQLTRDLSLAPIIVTALNDSLTSIYPDAGGVGIGLAEMSQVGEIGGETDPVRLASLLPGITTGADGLGGINLRGSDASHNLILLDGVPVYNLNHAYGLLSIFNSQALRRVDLYKNGIPTRFGGRLSGVLDVHTRDGNLNDYELRSSTSLLSTSLSAEGPIKRGKSSFFVAGRYYWASALLPEFASIAKKRLGRNGSASYQLYDLNLKFNQELSEKDRLYLSLYKGIDALSNNSERKDSITTLGQAGVVFEYATRQYDEITSHWGNTVGALRWNRLISDKFFSNISLSYSTLDLFSNSFRIDRYDDLRTNQVNGTYIEERFKSKIRQVGITFDGQWQPSAGREIRFGFQGNIHQFTPQILNSRLEPISELEQQGLPEFNYEPKEMVGYAEYVLRKPGLQFRAGTRAQIWYTGTGKSYFNLSPRLLLTTQLLKKVSWQTTFDATVQPVHLLGTAAFGLPSDIWVPSTDNLPPARTYQVATGVRYFFANQWELEIGAYLKRMEDLLLYQSGRNLTGEWESKTSSGVGDAKGLEFSISRRAGKVRGWVNYTLAKTTRNFDERINRGRTFPYRYDRRHSVNLVLIYQPRKNNTLTASWRYGSGIAYSLSRESFQLEGIISEFDDPDLEIEIITERNGARLPANHRLDINYQVQLNSKPESFTSHVFRMGIYNVYSRHNPIYYDVRTNYEGNNGELRANESFVQVFIAPVLPVFSYELHWKRPSIKPSWAPYL